jgi:hypothetical protein
MMADDWMTPQWDEDSARNDWRRHVPADVRAMWSELSPTHKWKLRQWALALHEAACDADNNERRKQAEAGQ